MSLTGGQSKSVSVNSPILPSRKMPSRLFRQFTKNGIEIKWRLWGSDTVPQKQILCHQEVSHGRDYGSIKNPDRCLTLENQLVQQGEAFPQLPLRDAGPEFPNYATGRFRYQ